MRFVNSTIAQFRSALRERYRTATREEAIRIGNWINLNLTDAEIKSLFGMTNAQVANFRTKVQNATTIYNSIQSAGGS